MWRRRRRRKEEKDNYDKVGGGGGGGGVGGGGEKRRRQQQLPYFDAVFAYEVLVYISDLRSLFRSAQDSLIISPPYDGRGYNIQLLNGGETR